MTTCIVFSAAGIERGVWDNRESHDSISSDDTILFSRVGDVFYCPSTNISKFSHIHRNEEFNGSTFVCAERVLYIIFSAALECTSISTPLVVGDKELQKTRMRGVGGVNASVAKIRHCSLIIIPILDNTYI